MDILSDSNEAITSNKKRDMASSDQRKAGSGAEIVADWDIDITRDICPMTFVRTRLALDRLPIGAVLLIRLRGDEPLRNVPRTAAAQGHACLRIEPQADGTTLIWLRRG